MSSPETIETLYNKFLYMFGPHEDLDEFMTYVAVFGHTRWQQGVEQTAPKNPGIKVNDWEEPWGSCNYGEVLCQHLACR